MKQDKDVRRAAGVGGVVQQVSWTHSLATALLGMEMHVSRQTLGDRGHQERRQMVTGPTLGLVLCASAA
jgi:hypothetical protein